MRILITGGGGFVGSNLADYLLKKDHQVIVLDNFYTGNIMNIHDFMIHPNFKLVTHDVCYPFANLVPEKIDYIYHLACPASPPHYQKNPIFTAKTSFLGTLHALELAKRDDAKILFSSTSEIYGDPLEHPQMESYRGNVNPIGIRSCYDEGKRIGETLMFDFHRMYNTKIKVVRIFNTYGPNMDPQDGRVVSNFIMQALEDKDITVYGDGTQTRSFQYILDLVIGLEKMMESSDDIIGPINIGNPNEFTMLELASKVIQMTKSKSKIIHYPLPLDDPKMRRPNISLAESLIQWQPNINLDKGLVPTIQYFSMFKK